MLDEQNLWWKLSLIQGNYGAEVNINWRLTHREWRTSDQNSREIFLRRWVKRTRLSNNILGHTNKVAQSQVLRKHFCPKSNGQNDMIWYPLNVELRWLRDCFPWTHELCAFVVPWGVKRECRGCVNSIDQSRVRRGYWNDSAHVLFTMNS